MTPVRIEVWHDVDGGTLLAEADIADSPDPAHAALNVTQGAIRHFGRVPLRIHTIHHDPIAAGHVVTVQHVTPT